MLTVREAKKEIFKHILDSNTLEDVLEGVKVLKHLRKVIKPFDVEDVDVFLKEQ